MTKSTNNSTAATTNNNTTTVGGSMDQQQIIAALETIKDDRVKVFDYFACLYIGTLKHFPQGLFFSSLRKHACELFPSRAQDGNFGKYIVEWKPLVTKLIEGGVVKVEERYKKDKNGKEIKAGNPSKIHHLKDEKFVDNVVAKIKERYSAAFGDIVDSSIALYLAKESGGSNRVDFNKLADDLFNL